jgi:DeoR/GlpR family transcriptional regulator of sugar metabolism
VAAATFARLAQIDLLITDQDAPADLVRQVRECGVEVNLV